MKITVLGISSNEKRMVINVDIPLIANSIACQMNMHEINRLLHELHDKARENKDGETLERLNRIFKYMELPLTFFDVLACTFMETNESNDTCGTK
jgi:hypothetical protein